ncbi:MAG: hypothetical protein KF729_25180 [Sandaracinaceae bacterium]|nr:hypothetical protein [Sandaracinaceae bacterium]
MRRALAVVLCLFAPAPASAWTDAAVRSVHAEVRVDAEARAHVTLTVTVRVHGGWLSGLEIAGLDPDLVLDEAYTPWAEGGDGERFEPRLAPAPGERVMVSFPRGRTPRRGDVRIGLAYHTALAHRATEPVEDTDRVRVSWTLPGWRAGLDGVQVDLIVPHGSIAGPRDVELDAGGERSVEVEQREDHTVLRFWRAHLPRTMTWTVRADVPQDAMDAALRGAPIVRAPPPSSVAALRAPGDPAHFWIPLALAIALLCVAQIAVVARRGRRAGGAARALLYAPGVVRGAVALAVAPCGAVLGLAGHAYAGLAALAVCALCGAHLPGARPSQSKLGAWRIVDARWLAAARRARWRPWLHPEALLDATTPLGALHAALWLALPWAWAEAPVPLDVRLCAAVLPAPILVTGTRLAFALGPTDALARLLTATRALATLPPGLALRPVMYVSADGEVQDVRIRTVLAERPDGLLRLDLALAHEPHAGGWRAAPVWLVVARADSPADVALRALDADEASSRGGRRVVRQGEPGDAAFLGRVLAALDACPPAREHARGVPAPLETVRDLPAPAAVGF